MSIVAYISLLCFAVVYAHPSNSDQADKRNLVELGVLLHTVTGHALDYNGYGCYCGWGGAGTPVDAVDRCCQVHDQCYGTLSASGCSPKLSTYHYTCSGHSCHCNSQTSSCEDRTCKCDIDFANCVAAHPYNDRYHNYDHSNC
ncbi:basic phospholipase A2 PA-5-like [Physella acuta]|uniref:basic phospholipase A2 PA-5-like n=1 Tax=Physella acuta TaxID=109671 RepID=UPI0027DD3E1E|nr:basic phospholipase A2 PA-5-like [Physella acuta]